jgi:hypothetical protein
MTRNLRLSLTILSLGFAIEGAGELYAFLSGGRFRPGVNLLFVFPVAATLTGLLFVWVGQREWSAVHRRRVRQAHTVFGLSVLGAAAGAATVAALVLVPSLGVPLWARVVFGAALGAFLLGTFVTYGLLVVDLVGRPSRAIVLVAQAWAMLVAAFVAATMATDLPSVVALAGRRSLTLPAFVAPLDALASYLFVSYFLLLAAYVDAHRILLRGRSRPVALPPGD